MQLTGGGERGVGPELVEGDLTGNLVIEFVAGERRRPVVAVGVGLEAVRRVPGATPRWCHALLATRWRPCSVLALGARPQAACQVAHAGRRG